MGGIRVLNKIISCIAVLMTAVQLYTYVIGLMPAMQQRTLFLGFIFTITLLIKIKNKLMKNKIDIWSISLLIASIISCSYVFFNWNEMSLRIVSPTSLDIIMGIIIITAVLDCTNIKLGIILPLLTMLFIFYTLIGWKLNGEFGTTYFSLQRLTAYLTMETSGIFGIVLGTAAKYIFIFVIFGSFLEYSGASEFFLEFTDRILGTTKGSGAKVDTISSGLFGMISGSAVANVMATAPMTIPMMKKNGFSSTFAGAVSSIAGTGGQLMPPIMGTAAFIIAETISVSYSSVAKSALIPGILFYSTLWITINIHSNHLGIKVNDKKKEWISMLKMGFYYAVPIGFLIITVSFLKWSPIKAGMWAIALIIVVSQINSQKRMKFVDIFRAMEYAAYNSLSVGAACATAGIIIGILSLTGLGLKFSGMIVLFSGENLVILLILTMISGLILGMGMTTTSVYIVLSVLVAPALVSFGISLMAAHLFVFYFGILSCITPPVSTAVYAAASVAKESPMKLAFYTTKVAAPIYLIPFMFIFNPELLMLEGGIIRIGMEFIFSLISIIGIAASLEGYYRSKFNKLERIILFLCSIVIFKRIIIAKLLTATVIVGTLFLNRIKENKNI